MKSHIFNALAAVGVLALVGFSIAPSMAAEPEPEVVLMNVNPQTGEIELGQELHIPLSKTPPVQLSPEGNVQVHCKGNPGDTCLQIGSSGSGGLVAPTLNITGPTSSQQAPIPVGQNPTVTWAPNGAVCYGIRSNPSVAAWNSMTSPRTSGSFSVGNLQRNQSSVASYALTLGCFSDAISGTGSLSTAYSQQTHVIYLAQTGSNPDPDPDPNPPTPSCNAYKTQSYGGKTPQGTRGFQDLTNTPSPGFTENLVAYNDIFDVPYQTTVNNGNQGMGFPPSLTAGTKSYMSIKLPIGSEVGKGVQFTWNTPQTPGYMGSNVIMTVSPCPGDFREPDNNSSDPWLTDACRKHGFVAGLMNTSTPNANGSTGGACRLNNNTEMYLNVAAFNFGDYWSGAETSPSSPCPPGKVCSVKVLVKQRMTP